MILLRKQCLDLKTENKNVATALKELDSVMISLISQYQIQQLTVCCAVKCLD